jgi:midasin (ATPase involved in ribosome maturation)
MNINKELEKLASDLFVQKHTKELKEKIKKLAEGIDPLSEHEDKILAKAKKLMQDYFIENIDSFIPYGLLERVGKALITDYLDKKLK